MEVAQTINSYRIVIIGGGFAGAYCAQALEKRLSRSKTEVLLVDRNNYFIFYPLLVEAGTGSLEPRHVVVPIREFLTTTSFQMARVVAVDTQSQEIEVEFDDVSVRSRIHYDHLVLAIGSVTSLPPIPGLREYAYEMKSLSDAVLLRDRAIRQLELADAVTDIEMRRALLHFVIVGGSFTGVEVAGEFYEYLREASGNYQSISPGDCTVTLVERSQSLLGALDKTLSGYVVRTLTHRGIKVILRTSVERIQVNTVDLNDGGKLAAYTVVWCAGTAPNPLLKELKLPVNNHGYLECEQNLRVKGFSNIWAIGDCASIADTLGNPYAATAQLAILEAKHLALNLSRVINQKVPLLCIIKSKGTLAAIGNRTAVAKIGPFRFTGFFAWVLWRTFYLMRMPRISRKVRVAVDWTLAMFFRRDLVGLGLYKRRLSHISLRK